MARRRLRGLPRRHRLRPGVRPRRRRRPSQRLLRAQAPRDGQAQRGDVLRRRRWRSTRSPSSARARRAAARARCCPGAVTLLLPNPAHRFPLACGADPETLGLRVPELDAAARSGRAGRSCRPAPTSPGGPDARRARRTSRRPARRRRPRARRRRATGHAVDRHRPARVLRAPAHGAIVRAGRSCPRTSAQRLGVAFAHAARGLRHRRLRLHRRRARSRGSSPRAGACAALARSDASARRRSPTAAPRPSRRPRRRRRDDAPGARGCDVAFHSAAHLGDWGDREDFERGNVQGTANVLEAARERRRAALRPRRHRGRAARTASRSSTSTRRAPLRPDSPRALLARRRRAPSRP